MPTPIPSSGSVVRPSATEQLRPVSANHNQGGEAGDAAMWQAAKSFEAVFLAEMFAHAGAAGGGETQSSGFAEDTYRSMLAREWADQTAHQGGVGLADQIYRSMSRSQERND